MGSGDETKGNHSVVITAKFEIQQEIKHLPDLLYAIHLYVNNVYAHTSVSVLYRLIELLRGLEV